LTPDNRSSITLDGNNIVLGPLKRLGGLTISGTGTVTLNGTLYITGDTKISGQNDNNPIDLRLNGNTIFVSSSTSKALEITQCIIEGPGTIIAVGDVYFAPKAQVGGEEKPIFVMSVRGTTTVQPSGQFCGAIAGKADVEMKQGSDPRTTYPAEGFGNSTFPRIIAGRTYSIASWEVTPL
jgi:hypothetical protein